MKNLILTVICILVSTVTFAGEPKKDKDNTFEISGYFLKNSNISYEVYEVTSDSWELIESGKGMKHYKVELETNHTYVVIFKKDEKQKLLFVDVQVPSYIDIDVDFKYLQDATLKYTTDMEEYKVALIKK